MLLKTVDALLVVEDVVAMSNWYRRLGFETRVLGEVGILKGMGRTFFFVARTLVCEPSKKPFREKARFVFYVACVETFRRLIVERGLKEVGEIRSEKECTAFFEFEDIEGNEIRFQAHKKAVTELTFERARCTSWNCCLSSKDVANTMAWYVEKFGFTVRSHPSDGNAGWVSGGLRTINSCRYCRSVFESGGGHDAGISGIGCAGVSK